MSTSPNYTLEIISHHPKFESKALRKYYVDGIETVGAWGDEPFEIRFKNNTWQKIQVKLSVDGTDILSGEPATTAVGKDMWVVNGYGTLSLKAWPETNNGGAAFVFTSANNSVAVHTHGDLSSRGIIAAAVFVEGHVEPIRLTTPVEYHNHYHYDYKGYPYYTLVGGAILNNSTNVITTSNTGNLSSGTLGGMSYNSCSNSVDTATSFSLCDSAPASASAGRDRRSVEKTKSMESLVAVGAGQHVDQKITYVSGLIKPTFAETVRVRYLWWDDLQEALRSQNVPAPHASGFPGDSKRHNINLGGTPRIGGSGITRESAQVYSRF